MAFLSSNWGLCSRGVGLTVTLCSGDTDTLGFEEMLDLGGDTATLGLQEMLDLGVTATLLCWDLEEMLDLGVTLLCWASRRR